MSKPLKDITGKKFGRLTVIGRDHDYPDNAAVWSCLCECGKTKSVRGYSLACGRTVSCGCYGDEARHKRSFVHGRAGTAAHEIWKSMRQRCYSKSCRDYPNYGKRGIIVCARWNDSFANFLEDMGEKPSPGMTIDRIDNDGPYSPENCRWATRMEQSQNRRSTRMLTYKGETKPMTVWSREYNLSRHILPSRIKAGWSPEEALKTPIGQKRGNHGVV